MRRVGAVSTGAADWRRAGGLPEGCPHGQLVGGSGSEAGPDWRCDFGRGRCLSGTSRGGWMRECEERGSSSDSVRDPVAPMSSISPWPVGISPETPHPGFSLSTFHSLQALP